MLFLAPVTEQEDLQVTSKLKTKILVGFDEILDMIVKQCIQTIIKPLTYIINLSLSSGTFPNQMKIAKFLPIFNKGHKQNTANYR
jgi:superfamily II DNA/RNA helicase